MRNIVVVLAAAAVACGSSSTPAGTVILSTAVSGPGAVALNPTPDTCTTCAAGEYRYARGTAVTVVPVAQQGATFTTWGGACAGTNACSLKLDADRSLVAVFERNSAAVGIQLAGDGQGAVTSDPAGIDCGGLCTAQFPLGSTVTLTAVSRPGSTFAGWSGGCSGTGTCLVSIDQARSVSALFSRVTASVTAAHAGPGTVLSNPAGLACGAACTAVFPQGTAVTLTALPDADAQFTGWSGACTTSASTCAVTAGSGAIATANFAKPRHRFSVSLGGTGLGTVLSAPAGLACGASCTAFFDQGTTVVLVASPAAGSIFTGWSGDCSGPDVCVLPSDVDHLVAATFVPAPPGGQNPQPVLTALSPTQLLAGSTGIVLTLSGLNFLPASRAFWNGNPRATEFVDANTLRMTLLDGDVAGPNPPFGFTSASVAVGNPAPGGGLSGQQFVSIVDPRPTLVSIDPTSAIVNSAPFQMVLTGTDFTPSTQVLINGGGTFRTVTFVSPTQLLLQIDALLLQAAGNFSISVTNATFGGSSASFPFTVTAAAPVATAIAPSGVTAGSGDAIVTVYGTGFISSPFFPSANASVARWNGADVVTSVLSPTELRATIPGNLLVAPGVAQLTVFTPAPGGGETAAFPFTIVAPPEISSFDPDSAVAGAAGFTLTIHGRRFDTASSVTWNGAPRATTLLNPTTLQIDVAAADVAAVGSGTVVVSNAGGATPPVGFPVLAASPSITSRIAVDVPAKDVVWDATRRLFYASVPSTAAANPNSVAIIDATGSVLGSMRTGSEPGRLSLADDASKLYVALDGASAVQRIDLARQILDLEIPLPGLSVADLQAVPGSPRSVAISRNQLSFFPGGVGVAIYDDDVQRPETPGSFTQMDVIAFAGPDAIYGFDNTTSSGALRRAQVIPSGVFISSTFFGPFTGSRLDIRHEGGRIYSSAGNVVDLSGNRVGTFVLPPFQAQAVVPDRAHGRVFFLSGATLSAFNAGSFVPLGSLSLADSAADARFVRWDADGIAYRTGTQVILIRSSIVGG